MKNKIIITFITIVLVSLLTTLVCAAEPQITINGDNTAKVKEEKELKIKIFSDEEIGIISGKIEANGNITNMNVTGINGWNLTYNKETGVFNIYKAEGSKSEEIISIKYTTGNVEGQGSITLSNLKMTTISYKSTEIGNVTKNITIANEQQQPEPEKIVLAGIKITKAPTKATYTVGEKFDTTGMEITATYSDGNTKKVTNYTYTPNGSLSTADSKITIAYKENGIEKTTEQNITVINGKADKEEEPTNNKTDEPKKEQDAVDKEKLPKTGMSSNVLVIFLLSMISVAIVAYFKYKKYKNI